jgi:hypothetical protein
MKVYGISEVVGGFKFEPFPLPLTPPAQGLDSVDA